MKPILLSLTLVLGLSSFGATYYVSTAGSSSNTGLTVGSPWPMDYAMSHCGSGSTVVVLPGTYSGQVWVQYPNVTLKAQVKWGARLLWGSPFGVTSWIGDGVPGQSSTVVDGFEIAHAAHCGVAMYGLNSAVRNCWIHHSGASTPYADSSGILCYYGGSLIEYNLLENNGWNEGSPFDHGVYINSSNNVVRANICRYNWGAGIAGHFVGTSYFYNNVTYQNHYFGFGSGEELGTATLYFYNNTMIETGTMFYLESPASALLTNNIFILGTGGWAAGGATISGDYNLLNQSVLSQAHGLVSTGSNFVDLSTGRYWLNASAPARGIALGTVHGPVDFWGNSQSAVLDVGAFQYVAAYAADARTLDPSSSTGADYWNPLTVPPLTPPVLRMLGRGTIGKSSW